MGTKNLDSAFEFFHGLAKSGEPFSLAELTTATAWAASTARTYLRKQWEGFIHRTDDGRYTVDETFLEYPLDVFRRINSQKFLINKDPFKPALTMKAEALITKSRESALLAVQVYNNPTLAFRTPSFIVHMIIAYTSLFHAIFEEQGKEYFERLTDGTPRLTPSGQPWLWDITTCAKEYWAGQSSAAHENIRLFVELRNEIEHRYAPAFDLAITEHCQALLLNYEQVIVEHFTQYFALGTGISIPLQLTKNRSLSRIDSLRELQREDYTVLMKSLQTFSETLPPELRESPEYQFQVLLVQVPANHAKSADLSMRFLRFDDLSDEVKSGLVDAVTLFKTKTVEAVNTERLLPKDVVKLVQEVEPRFRQYEHTQAWKFYKVRPRERQAEGCDPKYCHYDVAHGDIVYTMEWVKKLRTELRDANTYDKIRAYKDA